MLKFLVGTKRKAFTLIELMTTLVIMAIIVCAAIPFAMKKDIQKRAIAGNIGVFECYYEGDQLKVNIRTKDGQDYKPKAGDVNTANGTCAFNPNAEYAKGAKNFQIIAIGGGGAGGTYNDQGVDDDKMRTAISHDISANDKLESSHIKTLMDYGRMAFGTLSNAGGTNAWYWNGQTETEMQVEVQTSTQDCYQVYPRGCSYAGQRIRAGRHNSCARNAVTHCNTTTTTSTSSVKTNNSNTDYISVNNIGPRLCRLKHSDHAYLHNDLKEEDIFQAIYKYYGVAGSHPNGDIVYNMAAPSGLASCACLNDPVGGSRGTCMAGSIKSSQGGGAGVAYSYTTYTGAIRNACIGDEFSNPYSADKNIKTIGNHCDDDLKLAGTTFGCGSGNNKECNGQTIKSGTERKFPSIYHWGNDNHTGANPTQSYEKISMAYTHREGDLSNYGGDIHFRVVTHNGGEGHAIVPRGQHGDNPSYGGKRLVTASSAISSNTKGFINGKHGFYSSNNASGKCDSPSNRYINTAKNTWWKVHANCSVSGGCKTCCGTSTCWSCGSGCTAPSVTKYYYSQGNANTSCSSECGSCNVTNTSITYTDSAGKCEHLNCCNNYNAGSKTYTVKFYSGDAKAKVAQSKTLNCGDHLYVYRQIKGVPYERAFVASAGQNGAVRQGSYPKLDEQLVLQPGRGGQVSGDDGANGKASVIKKKSGQVVLAAQGGIKGSSDKLNDTWVGPCMLFSLRENFDVNNPGCLARHDVMRKPTYNSLLMANSQFLKSTSNSQGAKADDYKKMPGLGGDGAYANVFPDRFLLSKAIRDQVRLVTTYIGPSQENPWIEAHYTVDGLDTFTTNEFIGNSSFAQQYRERYNSLAEATKNFLGKTEHQGRVPNFIKATNGNHGAIVIIW